MECVRAADRRNPNAQSMLGLHYLMSENYEEALTWFSKTAEQNNKDGKPSVSFMLCHTLDSDQETTLNIIDYSTSILNDPSYDVHPLFSPIKEGLIDCLEKR